MKKYRVQKEFYQYDQVIVEASSPEKAYAIATDNWHTLPVEGVGDYVPTGKYFIIDDETGNEIEGNDNGNG